MYNLKTTRSMEKERFVNLFMTAYNIVKDSGALEDDEIDYDEVIEEAQSYLEEEEAGTIVSGFLDMVKSDLKYENSKVENNLVNSTVEVSEEVENETVDSSIELSDELLDEVETLLNSDIEYLNTEESSIFELNIEYSEIEDEYNGLKLTSKVIRGKKGFQIAFSLNDLEYYNVVEENLALI